MLGSMDYNNCIRMEVGRTFSPQITSLSLPGRLLWSNISGGERNNSGCVQPLAKPITWDCRHLPRIVYQHPKTEVNNTYLAVLQLLH